MQLCFTVYESAHRILSTNRGQFVKKIFGPTVCYVKHLSYSLHENYNKWLRG